MKKIIWIIIPLIILFASCSIQSGKKDTTQQIISKIAKEITVNNQKNIVVGRITHPENKLLEYYLREIMIEQLSKQNYNVIDRRNLREIAQDIKISYIFYSGERQINLSQGDILLTGEIININNETILNIQLTDLYTGETYQRLSEKINIILDQKEYDKYKNGIAPPASINAIYTPNQTTINFHGQNSYLTKEYRIYKSIENNDWSLINTIPADYINDGYTVIDPITLIGVNYRYKIVSVNHNNKETSESEIQTIFAFSQPEIVKQISQHYNQEKNSLLLTWNRNEQPDFSHYLIKYYGKEIKTKTNILTITDLKIGEITKIEIFSVNTSQMKSQPNSIDVKTIPKNPKIINYNEKHGKITINFEDETKYKTTGYEIQINNETFTTNKNQIDYNVPQTGIEYTINIFTLAENMKSQPTQLKIQTHSKPTIPEASAIQSGERTIFILRKPTFLDFEEFIISIKTENDIQRITTKNTTYEFTPPKDSKTEISFKTTNKLKEESQPRTFEIYGYPQNPKIELYQKEEKVFLEIKDISKISKYEEFIISTSLNEQIKMKEGTRELKFIAGKILEVKIEGIYNKQKIYETSKTLQTHSIPKLNPTALRKTITQNILILSWDRIDVLDFKEYILIKEINGEEKIIYVGTSNTHVISNYEEGTYKLYWTNQKGLKSNTVSIKIEGRN